MAQIVTITNPLTGQPAQVDQLDHTAQEIDDAIARALPGGEIDITLQQITGGTDAAEYSATATYAIGDYCTHDGKLYRCTTAITEPEAWTEAHWTETTVGAELTAIYTALAKKAEITKKATVVLTTDWTGTESPYTQTVTISGTTVNSKIDIQPDATAIQQMVDDETVALYIANENGTLTAYAVGEKPTVELTVQATITEVGT